MRYSLKIDYFFDYKIKMDNIEKLCLLFEGCPHEMLKFLSSNVINGSLNEKIKKMNIERNIEFKDLVKSFQRDSLLKLIKECNEKELEELNRTIQNII